MSGDVLAKAIVRNPSLLTYDIHNTIKLAIALYEEIGVCRAREKKIQVHVFDSYYVLILNKRCSSNV